MAISDALERLEAGPPQVDLDIGRGITMRKKKNGIPVMYIRYFADPERDPNTTEGAKWHEAARKKYSSESRWQREQEIDPLAGGGEHVFAEVLNKFHDKVVITDPSWQPDPRWDCVSGFDHGKVNPTAMLKAYVDFSGNIYFCGEYYSMMREEWANTVALNSPQLLKMPDINRMRWCMADPSIYTEDQVQDDGSFSSIAKTYRKHGVTFLKQYGGEQSDISFVEKMLSEFWHDLENKPPRAFIVCRNESDRVQPGLHPYDCPNFLWELRRARRAELTARQLMVKNPTEKIVDKHNHLRDCGKQIVFTLKKPAEVPFGERLQKVVEGLNPTSAQMAAQRFWAENLRKKAKTVSMRTKGRMR